MNRFILTLITILFFSGLANAQFNKGSILLGGQLSYNANNFPSSTQSGQESYGGNFVISAGKALKENTILGINLYYSPEWIGDYNNYGLGGLRYYSASYGIGIFYRVYKPLGKDFYMYGEAGANYVEFYQSGKDTSGNKLISGNMYTGSIYFMPGIAYKISNKVFLELTIPNLFYAGYSSTSTTVQSHLLDRSNQFVISTSLSTNPLNALGIGFRLNL
jgi:hypothetical protein